MTKPLTECLQAIQARGDKATKGPWSFPAKIGECYVCFGEIVDDEIKNAVTHSQNEMALAAPNLEFIAHSREDVPKLLKVIEKLREQRNREYGSFDWSEKDDAELAAILNEGVVDNG